MIRGYEEIMLASVEKYRARVRELTMGPALAGAGERDQITLTVEVSGDAPPSADTLLLAAGGGA
jgi:hypothetical protein